MQPGGFFRLFGFFFHLMEPNGLIPTLDWAIIILSLYCIVMMLYLID